MALNLGLPPCYWAPVCGILSHVGIMVGMRVISDSLDWLVGSCLYYTFPHSLLNILYNTLI
ncbi:hypothetical protein QL093DRAFT_2373666, partial [Fusarium oxysporum]